MPALSEQQCISLLQLSFKNSTSSLFTTSNNDHIRDGNSTNLTSRNFQSVDDTLGYSPDINSTPRNFPLASSKSLIDSASLHLSRLNLLRFLLLLWQRSEAVSVGDAPGYNHLGSITLELALDKICADYLTRIRQDVTFAKVQLTSELNSLMDMGDADDNEATKMKGCGWNTGDGKILNRGGNVEDSENFQVNSSQELMVKNNKGNGQICTGDSVSGEMRMYSNNDFKFSDEFKRNQVEPGMLSVGLGEVSDGDWCEVLNCRLNLLDLLMCVLVRTEELYDCFKLSQL